MTSDRTQSRHRGWNLRREVATLMLALWVFGPTGALASPPVADPAAGANRPIVETTPNGLPIVQIANPSAGGVSRNQFTRFDVDPGGVLLNNGTGISSTQLAGYVAPNPLLRSSATVILNEVTGATPSALRGYLEVAGQRAEVVLANPNGITCDGCGFINVSRGTLTTGAPVFGGSGSLDAFRVVGGAIRVEGAGLDASSTDQLDLLSRTIALNASIWATSVDAVTGANLVWRGDLSATPLAASWPPPAVSLDVGALGGMYAGKIRLVGTERGVGVASAGHLASTGEFTLESSGRIALSSEVTAAGALRISGSELTNSGVVYGEGRVDVAVSGAIVNGGVLAAQDALVVSARSLSSAGTLAAGVTRGQELTAPGALQVVTSGGLDATGGRVLAGGSLVLSGANVNVSGASVQAGADATVSATGNVLAAGGRIESGALLAVQADGDFGGAGVTLLGGAVDVRARTIDLGGGARAEGVGDLVFVSGADLLVSGATLRSGGALTGVAGGVLDATAADVSAAQAVLAGGVLRADQARLRTAGALQLEARAGRLGLFGADVAAEGGIWATSTGGLVDAAAGSLLGDTISLEGAAIDLSLGRAEAVGDLSLVARDGGIRSAGGRIVAGGSIGAQATGAFQNLDGTVMGRGVQIVAETIDSRGAQAGIYSAGTLGLFGTSAVRNELGSTIYASGDLLIGALRGTEVVATGVLVNDDRSRIDGAGNVAIHAASIPSLNRTGEAVGIDGVHDADVGATGPGSARPDFEFEVPPGGMFRTSPDPGHPLVETDPRFTDFRTFITSDYMLNRLPTTPESSLKRLGDGFVEEQLVLDQITYLTGRRFLDGYEDAQAQFQGLMDEGIRFAETVKLGVGVELSPEMTAGLTAPIVWMVKVRVAGQDVLVPKVYVPAAQEVAFGQRRGTITAGETLAINTTGDFTLSRRTIAGQSLAVSAGTIRGGAGTYSTAKDLQLVAEKDVDLRGTDLQAGRDLTLASRQGDVKVAAQTKTTVVDREDGGQQYDITATGGTLKAGSAVTIAAQGENGNVRLDGARVSGASGIRIEAGRDVEVRSVGERHIATKDGTLSGTDKVHQAGTTLSAERGAVELVAGNDATLESAQVDSGKHVAVVAGGDLTLTAKNDSVATGQREGRKVTETYDETVQATTIQAAGSVTLAATGAGEGKGTVRTEGAVVQAGQVLSVYGSNVEIADAREEHDRLTTEAKTKKRLLNKKTTITRDETKQDLSVGTLLSGGAVVVQSEGDLVVQGSQVVGGGDVQLGAGGDIRIVAGEDRITERHEKTVIQSGLLGSNGGVGITIGRRKEKSTTDVEATAHTRAGAAGSTTTVGSLVGSVQGNIVVDAQGVVDARGSDLRAKGDIFIAGQDVLVDSVYDTQRVRNVTEVTQDGFSVGVSTGLIDAGMAIYNPLHRANEVADERLKALYALRAARETQHLREAAQALEKKEGGAKALSINIGATHSESRVESTTVSITALGSTVVADGHVSIVARGDPARDRGDLTIVGSTVKGGSISLDAARDLTLRSAENRLDTSTDSESWSASVGLGVRVGAGAAAAGVSASASVGTSDEDSHDVTHTETQLDSAGAIVLRSGRDTTLRGAVVKGHSIAADVGRDLRIESEQDVSTYHSTELSASGQATVGSGVSASLTVGYAGTESTYRSVQEQSGLYAGKGGFDVKVGGNTDLRGGVIASEAEDAKNRLDTGTLTHSNIENVSRYSAVSASVTIGTGGGGSITPSVGVPIQGEKRSTTYAAVSPGAIVVREGEVDLSTLSRDTADAGNAIANIFDKAKVAEQKELVQVFGEEGFKAVGDLAQHYTKPYSDAELLERRARRYEELLGKGDDLTEEERREREAYEKGGFRPDNVQQTLEYAAETKQRYQEQYDRWKDGSPLKTALHAAVGAMQAGLGGGSIVAGGVGAGTSERLSDVTSKLPDSVKPYAGVLIGAVAARLAGADGLGAMTGGATAGYGFKYNRQLHQAERELIAKLANEHWEEWGYPDEKTALGYLSAAGCALVRCGEGVSEADPDGRASALQYQAWGDTLEEEKKVLQSHARQEHEIAKTTYMAEYERQFEVFEKSVHTVYPELGGFPTLGYEYTEADERLDVLGKNAVATRVFGGLQAVGGGFQIGLGAGGVAACPETVGLTCSLGWAALALGTDNVVTGVQTAWTGVPYKTNFNGLLRWLGFSPEMAAGMELVANFSSVGGLQGKVRSFPYGLGIVREPLPPVPAAGVLDDVVYTSARTEPRRVAGSIAVPEQAPATPTPRPATATVEYDSAFAASQANGSALPMATPFARSGTADDLARGSIATPPAAAPSAGPGTAIVKYDPAFAASQLDGYVVSVYGEKVAAITTTAATPTMGSPAGMSWVGPARVQFEAGSVPQIGINAGAPGQIVEAMSTNTPVYGTFAPAGGLPLRLPTIADGGANMHFWPGGGRSQVVGPGFVIRPPGAREWVLPGATPMPQGTIIMRFDPKSGWLPVRVVQ